MYRTLRQNRAKIVVAAALLTVLSAVAGGPHINERVRAASPAADNAKEKTMTTSPADRADEQRDENSQTFQLAGGARVEVLNVSGSVEIETVESGPAEVHVLRTAREAADLQYHQVTVEQTATGLLVRGLEDREAYKRGRQVRQQVKLRLPRDVSLSIRGVGGSVSIGEVDGEVRAERVGGMLEVGLAGGGLEVTNLGGHLRAGVLDVGQGGMRISKVGGHVELHFRREVNADLEVSSLSGRLEVDLPNVTMLGPESPVRMRARIGSGGAPLTISKVSGNIRLTKG